MKLAGIALLPFVGLSFVAAALCLASVPEAIRGEMREPEDVLGVYAWLAVSVLLGSSLLVAAISAIRERLPRRAVRRAAVSTLVFLSLLFALFAGAGLLLSRVGADWTLLVLCSSVSAAGAGTLLLQHRRSPDTPAA